MHSWGSYFVHVPYTMSYTPKVFIIILKWNGLQATLEYLDSVFNLNYFNCEVIIVDNR